MNNSLKYFKFWQKKRGELKINDDPQVDWIEMQSLLDKHLPLTNPSAPKKGPVAKFKVLKLFPKLLIVLSAAAMVYLSTLFINKSGIRPYRKNHRHEKDSLTKSSQNPIDSFKVGQTILGNSLGTRHDQKDNDSVDSTAESLTLRKVKAENFLGRMANNGKEPNELTKSVIKNGASSLSYLPGDKKRSLAFHNDKMKYQNHQVIRVQEKYLKQTSGFNKFDVLTQGNDKAKPNREFDDKRRLPNKIVFLDVNTPLFTTTTLDSNYIAAGLKRSNNSLASILAINQLSKSDIKKAKGIRIAKLKRATDEILFKLDFGILAGVNSSGSFSAAKQNHNFYGSSPVDAYLGVFASYNLDSNWGIGIQTQLFSPQNIATHYTHINQSKVDSGQSLQIIASRKIYALNIPLHVLYKVGDNWGFKGGPVLAIPVKQINANSVLLPLSIKTDSVYYNKVNGILNKTVYEQKLNIGFSTGAFVRFNRIMIDATYFKNLTGYKLTSDLGTYKSNNGTFQFSVGFLINKAK